MSILAPALEQRHEHVRPVPRPEVDTGAGAGLPLFLRSSSSGDLAHTVPGESTHASLPLYLERMLQADAGAPLETGLRRRMESAFDADFGRVQIHTSRDADSLARSLDADAFTVRGHIAFGEDRFHPGSNAGDELIAHELAHVVQQQRAASPASHALASPTSLSERSADRAAESVVRQSRAPALAPAPSAVQRQARTGGATAPAQPATPVPQQPAPAGPQPTPESPSPQTTPAQPASQHQTTPARAADVRSRVRQHLDDQNFDLALVADPRGTAVGARRVFYGTGFTTLDAVADAVTVALSQVDPANPALVPVTRAQAWTEVLAYYNQKAAEAERVRWQANVAVLYTPAYTFATTQPGATPGAQNSLQLGLGGTYRFHPRGESGREFQLGASVSLFNLGSGNVDFFQNALLSAQLQQVWNLGGPFHIGAMQGNVQAAIFGQLAAGAGGTYATASTGDRTLFIGFLGQATAGGQFIVNVAWFQVIVGGAVVYSVGSPTTQPGSASWWQAGALQGNLGLGGQF